MSRVNLLHNRHLELSIRILLIESEAGKNQFIVVYLFDWPSLVAPTSSNLHFNQPRAPGLCPDWENPGDVVAYAWIKNPLGIISPQSWQIYAKKKTMIRGYPDLKSKPQNQYLLLILYLSWDLEKFYLSGNKYQSSLELDG